MSLNEQQYTLRGHLVQARNHNEIARQAIQHFITLINNGLSLNKIEQMIDVLSVNPEFNITIHIEKNSIWDKTHSSLKRGESIPMERKIQIPKRVFDGAKKGKQKDLQTLFHEIGHIILNHKPIYMQSEGYIITELDDAEVQADYFADIMLQLFGITSEPVQLKLPF